MTRWGGLAARGWFGEDSGTGLVVLVPPGGVVACCFCVLFPSIAFSARSMYLANSASAAETCLFGTGGGESELSPGTQGGGGGNVSFFFVTKNRRIDSPRTTKPSTKSSLSKDQLDCLGEELDFGARSVSMVWLNLESVGSMLDCFGSSS